MIGETVRLSRTDTIRLLPSARLRAPALAPLADSDDEFAELAALDEITHGRLAAQNGALAGLDPNELVYGVPNHTFINAAFCYPRPQGNRFNGADRGAWYCAFETQTALAEVAFHLTRALEDTGSFHNTTDYAELFADFIGTFLDLRGCAADTPCLDPDIAVGYPAGQAVAAAARRDHAGIVYPSVRAAGGTCLAALAPAVVQNVRQGGLWRLEWTGAPAPAITKNPAG